MARNAKQHELNVISDNIREAIENGRVGFDSEEVFQGLQNYSFRKVHDPHTVVNESWIEKTSKRAFENLTEGSFTSRLFRNATMGLGVMFGVDGMLTLLTPEQKPVLAEGEKYQKPPGLSPKAKALIQTTLSTGVVAGAALL